MSTILLVVHLMIALAMIVLVLLQRSEGGALGIGGGGSGDGLMSGRGLGNALTRTTGILAGLFFLTSIGLTVLGTMENRSSVLDGVDPTDSNRLKRRLPHCRFLWLRPGITHTGIIICQFDGRIDFRLARIMAACILSSHGALYIHHRRRGFFSRQRAGIGRTWGIASGARLSVRLANLTLISM